MKDGTLPNNGTLPFHSVRADVQKTEDVLGFKHLGFEDAIKSVIGQLLELVETPGQKEVLEHVKTEFAKAG